ncbi:hypothetical protein RIVM261_075420 [Rivularia sp. IAM M-261]|nr:hypothetical protein RIVM261_075420 [Rivularia sp. IAM M-261]
MASILDFGMRKRLQISESLYIKVGRSDSPKFASSQKWGQVIVMQRFTMYVGDSPIIISPILFLLCMLSECLL